MFQHKFNLITYYQLAATPKVNSKGPCVVGRRSRSLPSLKFQLTYFFRGNFSWEGGVTLPQNSYRPSQNLFEASLYRKTILDGRLETYWSERHRSCYFYIRIIKFIKINGTESDIGKEKKKYLHIAFIIWSINITKNK